MNKIINETISKFKEKGIFAADSAFQDKNIKDILFISMYHDQALIPFKILNKKGINLTLGLNYKRTSPARNLKIKYKNMQIIHHLLHVWNIKKNLVKIF